jgi:uncharacterized membrane protein
MAEPAAGPKPISKARLEAFSDGVFAIIVTLLVLELRLPTLPKDANDDAIWQGLVSVLPSLYAWMVSFLVTIVFWVNHHRFMANLHHSTDALMWFNAFLLLALSIIPFPAAVIGQHPSSPLAVCLFGLTIALGGFMFQVMRLYATITPGLMQGNSKHKNKLLIIGIFFGPVLYTAAAATAYIHTTLAQVLYALITFYFILPWSSNRDMTLQPE